MRAAIMRGDSIVVDTIPDPSPQKGEVLVKTIACGICGSDLHALKHKEQFKDFFPESMGADISGDVVMGHEFCAEIIDHGQDCNKSLSTGTHVCSIPIMVRNSQMRAVGYANNAPGGFGELMVLSEDFLLPVANGLSAEHAALTEPMAVGLHAVAKANLQPNEASLVIGCGPVGLAVIAMLNMLGHHPIVAADFSPKRRNLAERFGADVVVDPTKSSPYSSWKEIADQANLANTNGAATLSEELPTSPGVFFECVGVPGVLDQMISGATKDCRFVVVGVCMETDHILPMTAISKEINMQFVLGYSPQEFSATLDYIAQGDLDVSPIISQKVGVTGVSQAFAELANPETNAKVLVEPWRD